LKFDEDVPSVSNSCRFILREKGLGAHWIRDWVGFGAGLDSAEKTIFLSLPGI
jgi:hypothetical protein